VGGPIVGDDVKRTIIAAVRRHGVTSPRTGLINIGGDGALGRGARLRCDVHTDTRSSRRHRSASKRILQRRNGASSRAPERNVLVLKTESSNYDNQLVL